MLKNFIIVICSLALVSCDSESKKTQASAKDELVICTTTTIVRDAVERIAGDKAKVVSIMGPGVDPHSYKASQGDLRKLREADLVFYNGLHLEGKMADILEKLSQSKAVFALGDSLDKSKLLYYNEGKDPDPHVWFDPMRWADCLGMVKRGLAEIDPDNSNNYHDALLRYRKELKLIDQWAQDEINTIPEDRRFLVTSHDAFQYFSDSYGIEVKALQGVSTSAEFGLRDVVGLVNFVCDNKIPALFTESSIPARFIESVQEGCKNKGVPVKIGGKLYSDALGTPGTYQGTYLGVFHHNVEQIVNALR